MLTALASGLLLGLSCGLAPGPLLALVLAQSLQHGPRAGCKVALAPLVTDAPIILCALFLATRGAEFRFLFAALSIAGGLFALYLAVDIFRTPRAALEKVAPPPRSWLKGVLTNLLSPHPWLFWMSVGAATLAKALATSRLAAAAFLGMFYFMLVGSKLLVAVAAGRSRQFLRGRFYRLTMQILAVLLAVFGTLLLGEGWKHLHH